MTIALNQDISFTYETLDGEVKEVESLKVDCLFTSNDGHRIVQGWIEGGNKGRSYRMDRMTNVAKVES